MQRSPGQSVAAPSVWMVLPLALLLLAPAGLLAQEGAPPSFEFSFSNPGARSMGFGGAFVALADDATAAFANPAGLVQLAVPEVSIEGRLWSYSTPNVEGGRGFGPATGLGLDTSPGLRIGSSPVELGGVSYLSVVYPWRDWSFAFYRHQLANYEFFGETEALFFGPWEGFPGSRARSWDYRKSSDLEIANYGLSGGYRVNDRLGLGLGLSYYRTRLSFVSEAFDTGWGGDPDAFWSATSFFVPELLVESEELTVDDGGWGILGGVLWRLNDPRWSVGAVVRLAPELDGLVTETVGPMDAVRPAGSVSTFAGSVPLPDVFGAGASFRTRDGRLTLGFEWDHVTYSSILRGTDPDLFVEDGNELRAGGEYVFMRSTPMLAVRLGAWLDPNHSIRYDGDDYVAQAVLLPGSAEIHVATGFGLAFSRFQLDLGIDISNIADTASLSTIYSF